MATSPGKVTFYRPGKLFPALSVTGRRCDLGCDYCKGHYLEGMLPVASGEQLLDLALDLEAKGARGILLSGGCDAQGKVPLQGFLQAVSEIKSRTELKVNVHAGLLEGMEEARALVSSGADCFSVDIVQDPEAIRRTMHLARSPEDYRRTLELLFAAGARQVAPHVCIGLSGDGIEGELASLRLVSEFPISSLILLSFLPARGTPMFQAAPPTSSHVLRVAKAAIGAIDAPVTVGCMRQRGDWKLEVTLLRLGIQAIAMPSPHTVRWAEEKGIKIEWREECCALQR